MHVLHMGWHNILGTHCRYNIHADVVYYIVTLAHTGTLKVMSTAMCGAADGQCLFS